MSDTVDLSNRIRACVPGHYLTREEVAEVLGRIAELEGRERSSRYGHLGWFYVKVKANADDYNRSFQIPERWAHLYEDHKADLEVFQLSQPFRAFAILLRAFGCGKASFEVKAAEIKFR